MRRVLEGEIKTVCLFIFGLLAAFIAGLAAGRLIRAAKPAAKRGAPTVEQPGLSESDEALLRAIEAYGKNRAGAR